MKTTKTEVTADIVVEKKESGKILLIKRKNDPYAGQWALPGGFVETDEEVITAAARELEEETGIVRRPEELRFIDYFDAPDRDPRGRIISFAFGLQVAEAQKARGADDAGDAAWFGLNELPELAFDHRSILAQWEDR